jgi:hypothetical protein
MSKRAFKREHGVAHDEWEEPPGQTCRSSMPTSMLGEPVADAERGDLLDSAASGHWGRPFEGTFALAGDQSPEFLEALLQGLEVGNMAAPMALLAFRQDPRVEPALLAAARKAPVPMLANFAQVLGLMGGEAAAEVLRERMVEAKQDGFTYQDHEFCNFAAVSLAVVSTALLRVDPSAVDAAETLVWLLDHPCRANRQFAAREACEMQKIAEGGAHRILEDALARQLGSNDPDVFAAAGPALAAKHGDAIVERCESLLGQDDVRLRATAAHLLAQLDHPRASDLLARWLPTETSTRLAVAIAANPMVAATDQLIADLARRGLADDSPSLRLDAIGLLHRLPPEEARGLAEQALTDEPDDAIKTSLQRFLA